MLPSADCVNSRQTSRRKRGVPAMSYQAVGLHRCSSVPACRGSSIDRCSGGSLTPLFACPRHRIPSSLRYTPLSVSVVLSQSSSPSPSLSAGYAAIFPRIARYVLTWHFANLCFCPPTSPLSVRVQALSFALLIFTLCGLFAFLYAWCMVSPLHHRLVD